MAYTNKANIKPSDPSTLPEPNQYATYISHRPYASKFKTHATLAIAKSSIGAKALQRTSGRVTPCDCWIYDWNTNSGWSVLKFFPRGTDLDADPWYKKRASGKRKTAEPTNEAVNAAIASIMGEAQ